MNAGVHTAIAQTAVLSIVQPKSAKEILVYGGIVTIAAVISDIDSRNSKSRQTFNKVITCLTLGCMALLISIFKFHYNPMEGRLFTLLPAIVFIGLTAFASTRPHREYAHSIFFAIPLALCVLWMFGLSYSIVFFISQMSHNIVDIPNKEPVKLLFPIIDEGICFNLFKSDGWFSDIIGMLCSFYVVTYLDKVNFTVQIINQFTNHVSKLF